MKVLLMLINAHGFSDHQPALHMRANLSLYLIYNLLQVNMQPIGSHSLSISFLFQTSHIFFYFSFIG